MALAARASPQDIFAERRYYYPSTSGEIGSMAGSSKTSRWGLSSFQEPPRKDLARELVDSSPTLTKPKRTPDNSRSRTTRDNVEGGTLPMKAKIKKRGDSAAGSTAEDGDEDDKVGVYMWEKGGKLVMEVLWGFKPRVMLERDANSLGRAPSFHYVWSRQESRVSDISEGFCVINTFAIALFHLPSVFS